MDSLSYVDAMPVDVSDHALWRAAERFGSFGADVIEAEVRDGIRSGRTSHDRRVAGLSAGWASRNDRYVWTEDRSRVYAIRMYGDRVVVTTTMRREGT